MYRAVLAAEPGHVDALGMLGALANQQGRHEQAIELLRRAIQLDPQNAPACSNLGLVLAGQSRWEEAATAFAEAIRIRPVFPEALNNLANVQKTLGRLDEAIANLRQAVTQKPDSADAWMNLGTMLWERGDVAAAAECFEKALAIQPGDAQGWVDLAGALRGSKRMDDSIEAGKKALTIRPGWEEARFAIAQSRMHMGDFENGWATFEEHWDWRLARAENRCYPAWDGSPLGGKRILLHLHHGFGDTIQFVRYAPMIAAMGGRVVLRCQRELVGIMRSVPAVEKVLGHDEPVSEVDVQCSLMRLPVLFRTTVRTVPASVPYLVADTRRVTYWRERMAKEPAGLKVGLNWAGSPAFREDRFRSMRLSMLRGLSAVQGIRFYSLQKGPAATDAASPPDGMQLIDWTADLHDFSDTAALMMNLDLVISTDTAVVHLAGAIGRPVWVMLHYVPGCFWLLDRADSPWYPTMRLFRQPTPGDWQSVLGQVAGELTRTVAAK